MTAVTYRSPLLEARVETVRSLINDLEVPAVVGSEEPVIIEPVKRHIFIARSHLLSTALFSFSRENGSYHLGQSAIPTVQSPYGIYVPAQEPDALIHRVKLGDERAFENLYRQYHKLIELKISLYFAPGYERDDFSVIGHLALFDAACCYKLGSIPFTNFLKYVLKNRIKNELKTANREKHQPLNNSKSLEAYYLLPDDDTTLSLGDAVQEPAKPFYEADLVDLFRNMWDVIRRKLSPLESGALELYVQGLSYVEIGEKLRRDCKQVDNALQRAKEKAGALALSQQQAF